MPAIHFLLPTVPAALCLVAASLPAESATCSDQPVTARGDPSRFEMLAKAKARGNWRAKVRTLPSLGAVYADWYKALAADYQCNQADGQYICLAVARPCKD